MEEKMYLCLNRMTLCTSLKAHSPSTVLVKEAQ